MAAMHQMPKRSNGDLPSGTRLGPYEIVSFLGAGGMGEVYRACDTRLDRTVAIKILPTHLSSTPGLKTRFQQEARSISGLQHPNICVLYDIGTQDGIDFLVMEYLQGQTLQEVLEQGPMPLDEVFSIGIQIGSAIESAHRHGVLHRDIKPGNIMLTQGGAKLMDFGLAKMQTMAAATTAGLSAVATISSSAAPMTVQGVLLGTVQYMSPEQIQGRELDGRSDIFSLGVVLYEALTGVRPFGGNSILEIASNLLHHEAVLPSQINSAVRSRLDPVVMKALVRERDQRYQSAQAFVDDLRAAMDAGAGAQKPSRLRSAVKLIGDAKSNVSLTAKPRIQNRYLVASLAVLLLLAAGWFGLRLARPRVHAAPAEAQRWYDVGTSALRDGSYYQASKALDRAIAIDGKFFLARARLSEALVETDQTDRAKDELLRIANADTSSLANSDSLYLSAVMATAGHDFPKAIEVYRQIVDQAPATEKPFVLVDLGRAYEKNEEPKKAMAAYSQAAEQNPQYATAFLHLGILYGRAQDLTKALSSFEKAETIYQALDRLEGRAEVAFQRGALFNQLNKLPEAKSSLEQALTLAKADDNKSQEIKTLLQLSSLAVDEGQTSQATENARGAVALAQKAGMENLVSRGFVDLGNSFLITGQYGEAEKYFEQALSSAQRNKSPRNEARARMSLASLRLQQNQVDEAVRDLQPALTFYRQGGYRTETALGLGLLARANQQKGEYAPALQANQELLRVAQEGKDPSEIAFAQTELASALALLDRYPEALSQLDQANGIYKSLGVQRSLAYNQMNRGMVLLKLGRFRQAQVLLDDLEKQARQPGGVYPDLLSQVAVARAQMALFQNHFPAAANQARKVLAAGDAVSPELTLESKRVLALAQAHAGTQTTAKATAIEALEMARRLNDPGQVAQTQLAAAEAMLLAGDPEQALQMAEQAVSFSDRVDQKASSWRALLLAGMASRGNVDKAKSQEYETRATESLSKLQQLWGPEAFDQYLTRPDVQVLRKSLMQSTGSRDLQSSLKPAMHD